MLSTLGLVALAAGCILPIPTEPEEADGGSYNSFPVIIEEKPAFPGPIALFPGQELSASLTVDDPDVQDVIYVRVFRDYRVNMTGPVYQTMKANSSTGTEIRDSIDLDTARWCEDAVLGASVTFDVVVADRPFDESPSASPPFKAVVPPGRFNTYSWAGQCVQPL